MATGDRAKRVVQRIYDRAADRLYDPIVVQGTFRIFGGDLHALVGGQAARAAEFAGAEPILDMPVGTAYFTVELARRHEGLVVGTDIAWGMVAKATDRAVDEGLTNLHAVQADAHHLPFSDDSFGAVMCTNGLQVIPGLQPTLDELARVLRPKGRLYVSIVNLPLGAALPDSASEHLPTMFRSRRNMISAVEKAGLTITSIEAVRLATLIEAAKP